VVAGRVAEDAAGTRLDRLAGPPAGQVTVSQGR
jgi:hypothetical protein